MLKQLISDWKAQAEYGQGTRSYVFSVCASELEEVLESLEAQKSFTNKFQVGKELFAPQNSNFTEK